MRTHISAYLGHLKSVQSSPHTLAAYARDLALVASVLESARPDIAISEITPQILDALFSNQAITMTPTGAGRSPSTLNRIKASVRSFCAWAEENGIAATNPARYLRCPAVSQRPPDHFADKELKTFLMVIRQTSTRDARRDRAIFEVFLSTGIRLSELVALNVSDVDIESKHMTIIGKGNVPTVKFLRESVRIALAKYLPDRAKRVRDQSDEDALFLSSHGTRITARQIARRLDYWLLRAGITKRLSPHSLRHTFATRLYEHSKDILVVQRALGHKNLATTTIYTHMNDKQLEDAIEGM